MPTFATPKPITATVTTSGAQVRVTATDRPDTVVLVEPLNSASKTDVKVAQNTKVDFAGGELSIKTTKSGAHQGSVAISVELPAGSRLALNLAFTDVRADGRLGDCALELASGQVQLDHIAALRGNFASGSVAVRHIAGAAAIEGSPAEVRIGEVEGVVTYQGAAGELRIGHALSDVSLTGANGSFEIDRAEASVTAKAANCPIRVGRLTRGQADLMNAAGGIRIGIDEGTAALVDAKSTKGAVRNLLSAQDDPDQFDNKVKVYARTRLDDIVIERAAG